MAGHKFDPKHLSKLEHPERHEREKASHIWPLLSPTPVTVLIDLGAGTGFFARSFAEYMETGIIWACDVSAEMVQHLTDNLPEGLGADVRPLLVGEHDVPLPDDTADAVFLGNVFHELEHPERTIAEAFRLLRPGGHLVVEDWLDEETPHGPPLEHRVSQATIVETLRQAGFEEVSAHRLLPQHHLIRGSKPVV